MDKFIIKDFNSLVPSDTEFFRLVTERVESATPALKIISNSVSENYQMFIALVTKLTDSCVESPASSSITARWLYTSDIDENNLGLAIAVRMILNSRLEDFFYACNFKFDENIISLLKTIVKDTFNEVYEEELNKIMSKFRSKYTNLF